ncbi:hypothetical protein IC619_007485 [Hazenella sp. IB182353]|uniref:CorA family divalent cation transporter n=1 Tax=Polycladospora coralii TaxID=2771432 RepID=UPI001747D353|nr:CorA family divalent cation transporter [Polycladospora coralii]MBS7530331.1 hypothetical protein [Polycladospora coralii]
MRFSVALEQLLEQCEQIKIQFASSKNTAYENEILIGYGKTSEGGMIFNHKTTSTPSVTQLVYEADRKKFPPQIDFKQMHFYIEDASADSCLALIFLCCKIMGVSTRQIPEEWVDYMNRWECGDNKSTGEPFSSWGCLYHALAQAYINTDEEIDSYGNLITHMDQSQYLHGFYDCLKLTIQLLIEKATPYEVPVLDHIVEYNSALAFLKFEYQKYIQTVQKATIVQLELPLIDSNRTLMVDAFLATNNIHMGLLRSFLSNDHERTWLHYGFSFMAIHRPQLKGTGKDIEISVEPHLNIHLKDLWHKLEALEEETWSVSRPCLEDNSPCQSWQYSSDQYDKLHAPKKINATTYGSKLTWRQVVSTIWELYTPAKSIQVRPYLQSGDIGETCAIYACPPVISHAILKKRLVAVRWDSISRQQMLVTTPSMKRYLALCASGLYEGKVPPIHPLPTEGQFDFVELSCGFAIIHTQGIYILDDWNNEQLDISTYKQEIEHVLARLEAIYRITSEINQKLDDARAKLVQKRELAGSYLISLHHWIAEQKLVLRRTILGTMSQSLDYNVQLFRQTVEKRWGLNTQLQELYDTVSELETIIRGYSEAKTNRMINMITIFGFPLALFGGLFGFVFENVPSPDWLGVHWAGFCVFLLLSIVSVWGLRRYFTKSVKEKLK